MRAEKNVKVEVISTLKPDLLSRRGEKTLLGPKLAARLCCHEAHLPLGIVWWMEGLSPTAEQGVSHSQTSLAVQGIHQQLSRVLW